MVWKASTSGDHIVVIPTSVKPIQAAPHRYAAPKILTQVNWCVLIPWMCVLIPWMSNIVIHERPASATKPAKVRICLEPSQTINKAMISQ